MKRYSRSGGFTLLELGIALAVLSVLGAVVFEQLGPLLRFRAQVQTQERLAALRQAILLAYEANQMLVDGEPGAQLTLASGALLPALPDASGRCTSSAASVAPLARYGSLGPGPLHTDGTGAPLCVFINARQAVSLGGVKVYFHSVAVVSGGWNGHLDTVQGCGTTGLSASGELTVCGDDEAVLFHGDSVAIGNVQRVAAQVDRIVAAYQLYFQVHYLADPSRDISVDYFATSAQPDGRWDPGGEIGTTGCAEPIPLAGGAQPTPAQVLGLSEADVTDPFGNLIRFDNCSAAVRSPANSDGAMQRPPYTASIQAQLPGGVVYQATAFATF